MNILHHKSYHVYNKKNIEKVRKDEEAAAAKEKEKQKRIELAESEARLELLRKRANEQDKTETPIEHVNLFKDYMITNEEHDAEEKAKEEKANRQVTMYLDKGVTEEATPWYAKSHQAMNKYTDPHVRRSDKKRKRDPILVNDDPLEYIDNKLKRKEKRRERRREERKREKEKGGSSIEQLRAKRLEREREERERAKRLYLGAVEEEEQEKEEPVGYNSQYNKQETILAKQSKRRRF